jgi:hydroxyacylglutathione hydrolase
MAAPPLSIYPLPAFSDNYIWLIQRGSDAVVVDPGDPAVVLRAIAERELTLRAILVTHHHHDHIGGVPALQNKFSLPVIGPADEHIPGCSQRVGDGDTVYIAGVDVSFTVLDVPGHTRGAVAFFGDHLLFSGDTLFAAGCGRLFEGTAEQMHASLSKLAALPADTAVYCGHEYTLNNLRFAAAVEPSNAAIAKRLEHTTTLQQQGLPSLPSTLAMERATNPFLRCDQAAVRAAAERRHGGPLLCANNVFAAIRSWKDQF